VTPGEIYRTVERAPERGGKPGLYVVVSRAFIAENDDVSTVVCAPVYSQVLGLSTEVFVGPEEGHPPGVRPLPLVPPGDRSFPRPTAHSLRGPTPASGARST